MICVAVMPTHARANNAQLEQQASAPASGLAPEENIFVDMVAAEFFENELQSVQSTRIEAATTAHYRSLSPEARAQFRKARRSAWANMSPAARAALRTSQGPQFGNLTQAQKLVFREIAERRLGVTKAQDSAYAPAHSSPMMRPDI